MAWEVDDLQEAIAELRERGVIFEEYDVPGLKTVNGIAEVEGNYPSKGGAGEKAAWFKDSEGNLHAIGQAVTRSTPRPAASQEHPAERLPRRKRRP